MQLYSLSKTKNVLEGKGGILLGLQILCVTEIFVRTLLFILYDRCMSLSNVLTTDQIDNGGC